MTTRRVKYTGSVYSVLLQRDTDINAHAIKVGGLWGVILGHGIGQSETRDIRAHYFLSSYNRVVKALGRLYTSRSGLVFSGGVRRSARTGLVDGFKKVPTLLLRDAMRIGRTATLL